ATRRGVWMKTEVARHAVDGARGRVLGERRLRIRLARGLERIRARLSGKPEPGLNPIVVGPKIVVTNRPIRERASGRHAEPGGGLEVFRMQAVEHRRHVNRPATDAARRPALVAL